MKIALCAILFALVVTQAKGDDHQDRIILFCNNTNITLTPDSNKAEIVLNNTAFVSSYSEVVGQDTVIKGSLEQTEYFYYLKFPSTRMSMHSRLENRYKISKLTGDYSWEIGEASFGHSAHNSWFRKINFISGSSIGKCIKSTM